MGIFLRELVNWRKRDLGPLGLSGPLLSNEVSLDCAGYGQA